MPPEPYTTSAAEPPCTHVGYYRHAGLLPIQLNDGLLILTILYCEHCGLVMVKEIKIKTGLAVPSPILPDFSRIMRRKN